MSGWPGGALATGVENELTTEEAIAAAIVSGLSVIIQNV